jgi:hypothetical protein
MFPYDDALLAAVQTVPRSIPDVIGVMTAIDATCATGDGLKWFNGLYLQVTQAVEARVATGSMGDGAWLALLDVEFAKLYFSALAGALSGGAVPDCWQVLFDRRNDVEAARIQFALAGINAHINHDLAEAIVNTCVLSGSVPADDSVHYSDYTALNSALDSLIDAAKKELNVRLLGDALPPFSRIEDTIAAWSVSAAREAAWRNAEHLWALRGLPKLAAGFLDVLDGLSAVIGKTLLVPVPLQA